MSTYYHFYQKNFKKTFRKSQKNFRNFHYHLFSRIFYNFQHFIRHRKYFAPVFFFVSLPCSPMKESHLKTETLQVDPSRNGNFFVLQGFPSPYTILHSTLLNLFFFTFCMFPFPTELFDFFFRPAPITWYRSLC